MKKTILLIAIAICSLHFCNAQVIQGSSNANGIGSGDIMFGAKAGFGVSTDLFRNYVNVTNNPTFFLGGLAEIPAFFDQFYLQPEVQIQIASSIIGGENLTRLYLQVPMMAKYHLTDEFAVEFGPQVGILIFDNWNQNIGVVDIQKVGFSMNAGGGYRLNENFYFNLRVGSSLSRVNNSGSFNFQIGANYFF
ncbi:MAG: hypothetical protein AB8B59_06840 [Maribacter sp.]